MSSLLDRMKEGTQEIPPGRVLEGEKQNKTNPYSYLLEKMGNETVDVYSDLSPDQITFNNPAFNSFKPESMLEMKYSEFFEQMNKNGLGLAMRQRINDQSLLNDIPLPTFLQEFNDPFEIEIEQGKIFKSQPEYVHNE